MTETTTEQDSESDVEGIDLSARIHSGDRIQAELVTHGYEPLIVIRPGVSDDGTHLTFDIDATGPDSKDTLGELLAMAGDALKNGEPNTED